MSLIFVDLMHFPGDIQRKRTRRFMMCKHPQQPKATVPQWLGLHYHNHRFVCSSRARAALKKTLPFSTPSLSMTTRSLTINPLVNWYPVTHTAEINLHVRRRTSVTASVVRFQGNRV